MSRLIKVPQPELSRGVVLCESLFIESLQFCINVSCCCPSLQASDGSQGDLFTRRRVGPTLLHGQMSLPICSPLYIILMPGLRGYLLKGSNFTQCLPVALVCDNGKAGKMARLHMMVPSRQIAVNLILQSPGRKA